MYSQLKYSNRAISGKYIIKKLEFLDVFERKRYKNKIKYEDSLMYVYMYLSREKTECYGINKNVDYYPHNP